METKSTPYRPITPELAASGLLVTIKQAAADEEASESTLKANAKARRLPAYQSHFGAPVMVLPSEVREFLEYRPDIASKYHPKCSLAVSTAGLPPTPSEPNTSGGLPVPDAEAAGLVGDLGIGISVHSLSLCQPSEIALVANTLIEIGRSLLNLVPTHTTPTNH